MLFNFISVLVFDYFLSILYWLSSTVVPFFSSPLSPPPCTQPLTSQHSTPLVHVQGSYA